MKKQLLILISCPCPSATVHAREENAAGLRFGDGGELLYQRDLDAKNFLRFLLAFPHFDGLSATGINNRKCSRWDWTLQTCDWYLNAGVGGALGLYDFEDSGFLVGIAGACAFGGRFKNTPVSLERDYRPVVGAVIGGAHFTTRDSGTSDWQSNFIFNSTEKI